MTELTNLTGQANSYQHNLDYIKHNILEACAKVRRNPEDVRLIAVTKTVDETALEPLLALGLRDFGENRWQQAKPKLEHSLAGQGTWHFIGRLQMNKVKYIAPRFDWVHSIDSLELVQAISQHAVALQRVIRILLQVNVSQEASKAGFAPEEAFTVAKQVRDLPGVVLSGLMTMAPQSDIMESTRPIFRGLREVRDDLVRRLDVPLPELSMGMSDDYSVAVEEGATMVRLGRALLEIS